MSVYNRKEKIQVEHHQGQLGEEVVRRQVVHDVGRERQATLARVVQIMWLMVIALESLLGIRVLLKLAAADPSVPFANFIYNLTWVFLWPFQGLTATPSANGVVFEVSTIIAMAAYVLFGWLMAQLVWVIFRETSRRSVSTYEEIK
jgi:hypothetical protein